MHADSAILLITCPDQRGLVAAVADLLYARGANILHADQHVDTSAGLFFMRVEWTMAGFDLDQDGFQAAFAPIAQRHDMTWRIEYSARRQRMAIFVSHYDHCLADLLYRHRAGELHCEIPLVVSNHEETRGLVEFYGIPFHHRPVSPQTKAAVEARQLELLADAQVDLVVLARYMQILGPGFVARYPQRIINIHHSFLPAFLGARPYHRAFERGVKIIGATSHYVTDTLDEGPIIEQDTLRVSHRNQIEDLVQKGRDIERIVLSRAVRWHLEHRILAYGNKTVVFD
jgi:formyltetrahydrofolate deformylase